MQRCVVTRTGCIDYWGASKLASQDTLNAPICRLVSCQRKDADIQVLIALRYTFVPYDEKQLNDYPRRAKAAGKYGPTPKNIPGSLEYTLLYQASTTTVASVHRTSTLLYSTSVLLGHQHFCAMKQRRSREGSSKILHFCARFCTERTSSMERLSRNLVVYSVWSLSLWYIVLDVLGVKSSSKMHLKTPKHLRVCQVVVQIYFLCFVLKPLSSSKYSSSIWWLRYASFKFPFLCTILTTFFRTAISVFGAVVSYLTKVLLRKNIRLNLHSN